MFKLGLAKCPIGAGSAVDSLLFCHLSLCLVPDIFMAAWAFFFSELWAACLLSASCQRQETVVEQHYPLSDILIYLEKADKALPT